MSNSRTGSSFCVFSIIFFGWASILGCFRCVPLVMKIVFTQFESFPDSRANLPPKEKKMIDDTEKYIRGRLMPLKDDMDKEEASNNNCLIRINMPHNTFDIVGYSPILRAKIESSYNDNDGDILGRNLFGK
jgi:hypothetical protein